MKEKGPEADDLEGVAVEGEIDAQIEEELKEMEETQEADLGEEETPVKEEDEAGKKRIKRRKSKRRKKVLVVVIIIVIALIIGLWGMVPGDYLTVREVVKNSSSYIGNEIEVKGKVGNWSGGQNFTLLDDSNASIAIYVVHRYNLPDGFAIDKDVVVKGKLEDKEGGLTINSTKIQVGCPSKY